MYKNLHIANNTKLDFLSGGFVKLNDKWRCTEKVCNFTRLYYIYSGNGVLQCNGQTITMTPGNLYLLPANLAISYHCPAQMEQLFLHVTLTNPEGFDILSSIPKICQIPCSRDFLAQLYALFRSNDYCQVLDFKNCVTKNIIEILGDLNLQFPTKSYSQEVLQAISYMQNNLSIQLSSEQIANALFISPSRLHKRFKAETGISLGAYQDRLIFHRATLLLAERQLSIKEISQQLGFCDQYYFSRRFKAQIGITPTNYRKQHLT